MPQFPYKWPPVAQLVAVVCIIGFMAIVLFQYFTRQASRYAARAATPI